MKNVKKRSKFHEKMAVFCHYLTTYGKLWSERSFLLIFSARDDLVNVSWKSDTRKCQYQSTLLTLTSWLKEASPFGKVSDKDRASFQPPISIQELKYAIRNINPNSWAGPDGVTGMLLRFVHNICPRLISYAIMNYLLASAVARI